MVRFAQTYLHYRPRMHAARVRAGWAPLMLLLHVFRDTHSNTRLSSFFASTLINWTQIYAKSNTNPNKITASGRNRFVNNFARPSSTKYVRLTLVEFEHRVRMAQANNSLSGCTNWRYIFGCSCHVLQFDNTAERNVVCTWFIPFDLSRHCPVIDTFSSAKNESPHFALRSSEVRGIRTYVSIPTICYR